MNQTSRATYDRALAPARRAAFPRGEFVGQESFMEAGEIRRLARLAGIRSGTAVLDVCCGVAGPGGLIARETGCSYLGVDARPDAVDLARQRTGGLSCRFVVGRVPPLPGSGFDVVMLLETMLAFRDKAVLLEAVAQALAARGRFVFTVEEGPPLSPAEAVEMPAADTVWPVPLPALVAAMDDAGLRLRWLEDRTSAHRRTAAALLRELRADRAALVRALGEPATAELLRAHTLWVDWLASGRVRKFAGVATRADRG